MARYTMQWFVYEGEWHLCHLCHLCRPRHHDMEGGGEGGGDPKVCCGTCRDMGKPQSEMLVCVQCDHPHHGNAHERSDICRSRRENRHLWTFKHPHNATTKRRLEAFLRQKSNKNQVKMLKFQQFALCIFAHRSLPSPLRTTPPHTNRRRMLGRNI